MEKPNVSEDLLQRCGDQRPDKFLAVRTKRCRPLDSEGIDSLIYFKFRTKKDGVSVIECFPLAMPLQVKTSDDNKTIGLVIPPSGKISEKFAKLFTARKLERIEKHLSKHPHVRFMLFVSRLDGGKTEAAVIEEIWRELKGLRYYVQRYYIKKFR